MHTSSRLLTIVCLGALAGCYGDKVFVEDGAGGAPTSNPTGGNPPQTGGNGAGGNGAGTSGGEAPSGGGGGGPECTSPSDCPTPGSECIEPRCDNSMCIEFNKPAGDPCNGTRVCDGEGACVECVSNVQCTAPNTCDLETHQCAPPICMNGSQDTGETDIDCGGTSCPPCLNNDSCLVGSDCVTGFCATGMVCAACTANAQCPATDFCQGGICTLKLNDGSACLNNNQCGSGNCVPTGAGDICCGSPCTGSCQSCAMVDTGLANGTCGNTMANLDPINECPSQPCRTGTCNGSGACGISPVNTPCNDGIFCNGSDICDATGACSHSGNPCPADSTPDADCSESCDEASNNCNANDPVGTPCTDLLFCTGADTCNGSGSCVGGANPCTGPLCTDGCNEGADACNALQTAGSACNADLDTVIGMCSTSGACLGD